MLNLEGFNFNYAFVVEDVHNPLLAWPNADFLTDLFNSMAIAYLFRVPDLQLIMAAYGMAQAMGPKLCPTWVKMLANSNPARLLDAIDVIFELEHPSPDNLWGK